LVLNLSEARVPGGTGGTGGTGNVAGEPWQVTGMQRPEAVHPQRTQRWSLKDQSWHGY